MHSPLSKHKHPTCIAQIDALNECHRDNPWLKFAGVCNLPAAEVTRCFKAERAVTRSRNLESAEKRRELPAGVVSIKNTQRFCRLKVPFIEEACRLVLSAMGASHYNLGLWFTVPATIRRLNLLTRDKDSPTDVLSLQTHSAEPSAGLSFALPPPFTPLDSPPIYELGSIILCPQFISLQYPSLSVLRNPSQPFASTRSRSHPHPHPHPSDSDLGDEEEPPFRRLLSEATSADPLHCRVVELIVHSSCHLAGHTHDHDADFALMLKHERLIWESILSHSSCLSPSANRSVLER